MEQKRSEFDSRGLRVAVITYDSPPILKDFAARRKVTYPLLSDNDSAVIRRFGILNTNVAANTPFHGVPFPGTYVVDAKGVVKSKYFEDDYRDRFSAGNILYREFDTGLGIGSATKTDHLTLRTSASNATVFTGSRIVLAIEIELPRKMHIYAPGVQGYKAIEWKMEEAKQALAMPVRFPPSRPMRLKAISETVPVYEKKVRLTRDLAVGVAAELGEAMKKGELEVAGVFEYQACDDKACYLPRSVPVKWKFAIDKPDSQRAPAALRDKVQ